MADMVEFLGTLRTVFAGAGAVLVLFRHGTLVLLEEPADDPADAATRLLKDFGPVGPGSSAGDFGAAELTDERGWLVQCHHERIFTFVPPNPEWSGPTSGLLVGLHGRSNRDRDADACEIVAIVPLSRPAGAA